MTEEKITELIVSLNGELSALNANMRNVLERLTNHENRIMDLERGKGGGWKEQLIMLLARAVVIGAVSVGALTGAGSILGKIFGVE